MRKPESEKTIRHMVHVWAEQVGVCAGETEMPSSVAFRRWADSCGYGSYFNFRSTMGPEDDAERWFDQELKQSWRN